MRPLGGWRVVACCDTVTRVSFSHGKDGQVQAWWDLKRAA